MFFFFFKSVAFKKHKKCDCVCFIYYFTLKFWSNPKSARFFVICLDKVEALKTVLDLALSKQQLDFIELLEFFLKDFVSINLNFKRIMLVIILFCNKLFMIIIFNSFFKRFFRRKKSFVIFIFFLSFFIFFLSINFTKNDIYSTDKCYYVC